MRSAAGSRQSPATARAPGTGAGRGRSSVVVLLGLLQAASAMGGGSEPSGAPVAIDRFDSLVTEIGDLRSDLDWLDRRERTLLNDMERLDVESELRSRELTRLSEQRERTFLDLAETRIDLERQRGMASREEAGLAGHLRETYKMGRLRELRLLLALEQPGDLMPAITYLNVLTRRQSDKVAAVREARDRMIATERVLRAQQQSLETVIERQAVKMAELEEVRARSIDLLRSTREDQGAHRSAIAELARAASALEAAIVSGSAESVDLPAIDVAALKGTINWPVSGSIDVPFGDIEHPRFKTVTPHPGLDIRTEPAAPIRAVLGGRVVFSRRFSGYGNTVIIDHGGKYLTVTARAAILKVAEGDGVLPGQILGLSGEQAFDGGPPTVYFEIRHEGRALDPAAWLKRKQGSGGES